MNAMTLLHFPDMLVVNFTISSSPSFMIDQTQIIFSLLNALLSIYRDKYAIDSRKCSDQAKAGVSSRESYKFSIIHLVQQSGYP